MAVIEPWPQGGPAGVWQTMSAVNPLPIDEARLRALELAVKLDTSDARRIGDLEQYAGTVIKAAAKFETYLREGSDG